MGKRKSSKKPPPKGGKSAPLDKSFRCLFCEHTGTVSCKMDVKNGTGRMDCKDCGKHFVAEIHHLTEPIDVYSEWIDHTEEVNKRALPPPRKAEKKRPAAVDYSDEEDLNEIGRNKKRRDAVEDEDDVDGEREEAIERRRNVVEDDEDDD
ncbi:transcription elongation factor 1 [Pseudohyphozyma bogoriensis]|nr:transcription elongation factor 1 [Pseudohyphozyma bogoriensis]